MSELDEDVVAGTDFLDHGLPASFIDETLGAAAVDGMVLYADVFAEEAAQNVSPSAFLVARRQVFVGHGRVADHENSGDRGRSGSGEQQQAEKAVEQKSFFHGMFNLNCVSKNSHISRWMSRLQK